MLAWSLANASQERSRPADTPFNGAPLFTEILAVLLYEIRLSVADLLYFGATYEVKNDNFLCYIRSFLL